MSDEGSVLKRTETLVSEASIRSLLKRKTSKPCLKVAITKEERDAANKVAKKDNPSKPPFPSGSLSSQQTPSKPTLPSGSLSSPQQSNEALSEQGNVAFAPPQQNTSLPPPPPPPPRAYFSCPSPQNSSPPLRVCPSPPS